MSKKFRSALKGMKDTYPSPNPEREAAFLRSLPAQEVKKKRLPFLHMTNKPLWYSVPAVVTAAVLITVGTGVYQRMGHHDLPSVKLPAETQTTTVDGHVYETQQTDVSTESSTNMSPSSEGNTDTESHTDAYTNIYTNTDMNVLQTDVTEAPYVPEVTQNDIVETLPHAQTDDNIITAPSQTETAAVPKTTESDVSVQMPTDSGSVSPPVQETSFSSQTLIPDSPQIPISTEHNPNGSNFEPIPDYSDYRVTPAQRYSIMGNVYDWEEVPEPSDSLTSSLIPQEESWQKLASKADVVVSVHVDMLYYTLAGSEPYTQIDATVIGTYKGSLNWGDRISVYEKGGYVPVEVYQSLHPELESNFEFMQGDTLFVAGNAIKQVQTDNVYLLFLNYAQDADIPEGAFIYTGNDNVSRCVKENKQFIAMNGMFSVKPSELLQFASTSSSISVQLSDQIVNGKISVQLLDWLLDGTFSIDLSDLLS